jgi:NTE family protein
MSSLRCRLGACLAGSLFWLVCLPASAAAPDCIGLVLGGGGARGAAHIGVLKVLERERIPICAIAGTSMGAIVGSLYAVGYRADAIEQILTAIDWKQVLADEPGRAEFPMRRKLEDFRYLLDFKLGFRDGRLTLPLGLLQGQKLELLLRRLLLPAWEVEDFDRLPIPFRCVGTDIGAGAEVVYGRGDLAAAVRASMSVPGAFAPIRVDGRLMVDGGIVNNVPVDVVKAMGAQRVIVVDVGAPLLSEQDLSSPVAVSLQMISVLMQQRTESVLAALTEADIVLRPVMDTVGSADFDRAASAIPAGIDAAEAALPALRGLSVDAKAYASWLAGQPKLAFDPPLVALLETLDGSSRTARYVADQLREVPPGALDLDRLEQSLGRAYGQGNYERIDWRLRRRDEGAVIEVQPVDKGWGPTFLTFGLQISDDFEGESDYSLVLESTHTGLNVAGGEWRNILELGRVTGLRSEFFQPWGQRGRWFFQPSMRYRAFEQPIILLGQVFADYRVSELTAELETGLALGRASQLSARLIGGRDEARRRVGNTELPSSIEGTFFGLGGRWIHDSLDSADFPRSGSRFVVELDAIRPYLGTSAEGEILRMVWDSAFAWDRHHLLLGGRVSARRGTFSPSLGLNSLGGFANLSSRGERQLIGPQSALLRAVYYRRFGDMSRLFSLPAYAGFSLESGGAWPDYRDLFEDPLQVGALFVGLESPFGPIFLGYGRDNQGQQALHLTFGSLLRP